MTYGQKLKELSDDAVKKLKYLNEIKDDFNGSHVFKKYPDRDLQRAENEHRMAVNAFGKVQQEMNDGKMSFEDNYPAV